MPSGESGINHLIVLLNRLSAKLRANHPIITAEAGQRNAPKTLEMLDDTVKTMAQVKSAFQADPGKTLRARVIGWDESLRRYGHA